MKKFIVSAFIFFCLILKISCQNYEQLYYGHKLDLDLPSQLASRVHSLDDFIGRYNGYHNNYGVAVNRNSSLFKQIYNNKSIWKEYRRKVIGSLIAKELFYKDSLTVNTFARSVSLSKDLDFYRNIDHVLVPIKGKWDKKVLSGVIQLKLSVDNEKKTCWQIDKVHFDQKIDIPVFKMITREICNDIFIPPSAQDNGFISLKKVLRDETPLNHHITNSSKELSQLHKMIAEYGFRPTFENYYFIFNIDNSYTFKVNKDYKIVEIKYNN